MFNHSAAELRLFLDADQTTGVHPSPEAVRGLQAQGPTRTSCTWDILRTGVRPATRILKHPSFVGCLLPTTSSRLTPCSRSLRLSLLFTFVLAIELLP